MKYNTVLRCFSGDAFVVSLCVKLGLGEVVGDVEAAATVAEKPPVKHWKWLNSYTTTIHSINSCVLKASKLTRAGKVWRGFSRAALPKSFWEKDEYGICGGIEFGFSSTTTEMRQALHYAQGAASTVFEMRMGMVDRGASLRWLSQYPHENEILYAAHLRPLAVTLSRDCGLLTCTMWGRTAGLRHCSGKRRSAHECKARCSSLTRRCRTT